MSQDAYTLKDTFKGFTLDQDKTITPQQTVKRFRERLKSINLDILKDTVRIDNGRLDIPVFFSRCGKDAMSIIGTKKQMGKGATPSQAEASAVMELAERFSFFSFYKKEENFFTDQYKNLGNRAIPFDLIARSVHDQGDELDISRRIFENLHLKWTMAYNYTRNEDILIPMNWFYTINEFNGPCAGNAPAEALVQGICEVVERHVSALISHNCMKVPAIKPESATDPMVKKMLAKYDKAGIKVYLSDFTLEMGIPTVGVMAYDPSTFPQKSEIVWTAGTTPNPEKALSRALTEVAQLAGDFNSGTNYVASGLPKLQSIDEAHFITRPDTWRNISQLPDISNNNLKIEVENCIATLKNHSYEVLAVSTEHERLQIPSFYTIIPGAYFRERSLGTSVAMFSAKIIAETYETDAAISALNEINQLLPDKYFTWFYLGMCHLERQDPETALAHFKHALNASPNPQDAPSIYSYMGLCLKDMGRYKEALDILEKGSQIDSERTDIHNLMGFCWFKLKEHEKAIASFQKVIELNPSSAIDYANIASNYRDMGKISKAIKYYELALRLDPTIDFALQNLLKLQSGN
ncbi:MAG: YcaO-like family protein [Desulfobacteraceae bacterium]|jgi:ribosomal protein S12 methylthiotransferase accessory factor